MNVYLDTWALQTLSANKTLLLNKLLVNCTMVFSITQLCEIAARQDQPKAMKTAKFMDSFSNKIWLRNSNELEICEIKNAIYCFKELKVKPFSWFVNDFVETLPPDNQILSNRLSFRGKSVEQLMGKLYSEGCFNKQSKNHKENLQSELNYWGPSNAALAAECKLSSTWHSEILKNFKRVLTDKIHEADLLKEFVTKDKFLLDDFLAWLLEHLDKIPSTWITYSAQHWMFRDAKKWECSDFLDLDHLVALPYVDYLTVDKGTDNFARKAIKFTNERFFSCRCWNDRLCKSLEDLSLVLSRKFD